MKYLAVFGVTLLFLLSLSTTHAQSRYAYPSLHARPAPPFLLQDPEGEYHRLMNYAGRVLIVNFWASWCAPCREELPELNRLWAELRDESVAMLAINVSDDPEAVAEFMQDHPIDFKVLLDPHGRTSRRWQVSGLPTTFVLDSRGRIAQRLVGKRDWEQVDLRQLVRTLSRAE